MNYVTHLLDGIVFAAIVYSVQCYIPGPIWMKAIVGGVEFALIRHLQIQFEKFENPNTNVNHPCPKGYTNDAGGDCRAVTPK